MIGSTESEVDDRWLRLVFVWSLPRREEFLAGELSRLIEIQAVLNHQLPLLIGHALDQGVNLPVAQGRVICLHRSPLPAANDGTHRRQSALARARRQQKPSRQSAIHRLSEAVRAHDAP